MAKHNSGSHYIKIAEKAGLTIKNGKGDHAKVIGPEGRGYMIIPAHKELSNGTEYAIRKWFKALGILVGCLIISLILVYGR